MNKKNLSIVFDYLRSKYDGARTELNYFTPFQLLVAVILSAQTTDKQVNKVTDKLFLKVQNPSDVVDMGLEEFTKTISSVNYYRNKAKNIFRTSEMLNSPLTLGLGTDRGARGVNGSLKETPQPPLIKGEIIPSDIEELQKLPGVGEKTAKVISHVLYGTRVIAVDTHVHRVANRLGIIKTKHPLQTSTLLEKKVPEAYKDIAHHGLVLFGRYHCTARKPKCESCELSKICKWCKLGIATIDITTCNLFGNI